jgi:hypothetical protein
MAEIDPDIIAAARQWGLPAELLYAVQQAEGGRDALTKAVQCSLPSVTTRLQVLDVLCRSCVHAMSDFIYIRQAEPFVVFWASRWAPPNAANDPTHLNQNWAGNVERFWGV